MIKYEPFDILIVEDNDSDAELTVRSLRKNNLANRIYVAEDGAEALDFIFCRGEFADRDFNLPPKVIFLDLKLMACRCCSRLKAIRKHGPCPW